MLRFTLERQISFAFLVAFLILIIITIFSYRSVSHLTDTLKTQKQTQLILKNLDESMISILNIETAGRGYILTGKETFLEPYHNSKDKIGGQIQELKTLLADSPQQLEQVSQLEKVINEKLEFVKKTDELNQNNQTQTAVEMINSEQGRILMNKIRMLIGDIEKTEMEILDKREASLDNSVKNAYWMLLLGSIGGVISIGLANLAIFRETTKRSKAEKDLKEVNKNLETLVDKRTGQLSKANQELKQKSDFVQTTLDSISANIAVVDKKGDIIIINERWNNFSKDNQGDCRELLTGLGQNYLEVCRSAAHKDEIARTTLENLQRILNGQQQTFRIEYPCHAPHEKRWFILQINALPTEEGNAVISHFDITDRKKIENDLKESEEFNRSIVENSPDCVTVLDVNGNILSMNNNGMFLMEIDDLTPYAGKPWVDFWTGETHEKAVEIIETARRGNAGKLEGFCRTAKNTLKYWEVSVNPVLGEDGKPIRLISISRDITERKETEEERERLLESETAARREAEISNHMRDEFLATLSHELRAPLNSMLGWGKMLQQGGLDEEMEQKAIETIVRNAQSQNRMIEDLLDVSRIISGKVRLEITKVKLSNLLQQALESAHPAADAKNISLEVIEDKRIGHIPGDPNRLQQVIWNLLANAIKFTPNGGKITIETSMTDSEIKLNITDTGIGIKEEFLPFVFRRFSQADSSSIRKFGGLGIGLAIVRHITEMHGGTVSVFSEGENKGASFTITLPAMLEVKSLQDTQEIKKPTEALPNVETDIRLDGMLILIVDDEADSRQMLVQALTLYGATVITASSAREALEEIKIKSPDVLVSDIGMPEEDGYSLIHKIRELANEKAEIPAIALTAFTSHQDRNRALLAGFQYHLAKPVEFGKLAKVIADITDHLTPND